MDKSSLSHPREHLHRQMISLLLVISLLRIFSVPGIAQSQILTHSVSVQRGWNVISLPVITNMHIDSIFPNSVSDALVFQTVYEPRDTVENGHGFWMKFDSAEIIQITGIAEFDDTIEISAGWNMIGGISSLMPADKIITIPESPLASYYLRYQPGVGYIRSDTLRPGVGYWVKATVDATLIMTSMDVPCPGIPIVDWEGKTYNTVQIRNQCWLRENLNIGQMVYGWENQSDNGVIEKYCLGDDPIFCRYYGGFYQWGEATQYVESSGVRGLCPPGWHIPTLADFDELDSLVGGDGNKLKDDRRGIGPGRGTNETGFGARLGGYRQTDGVFTAGGMYSYHWTSTRFDAVLVYSHYLYAEDDLIYVLGNSKDYGFSIRCIKD